MNWFTKIVKSVASLFSNPKVQQAFSAELHVLQPYIAQALPIVADIEAMVPVKTDATLKAVADKYGVSSLFQPGLPKSGANTLLKDVAVAGLQALLPNPLEQYLAETAIQLALTAFRGTKKV